MAQEVVRVAVVVVIVKLVIVEQVMELAVKVTAAAGAVIVGENMVEMGGTLTLR